MLVRVLGGRRPWSVTVVAVLVAALGWVPVPADGSESTARDGACTITGTPGPDVLVGGPGADVICGLGGADRLVGRSGADVLRGGDGEDVLIGNGGEDTLDGGAGDDVLRGGAGDDSLLGLDAARFRDVLDCGPGGADEAVADPRDQVSGSCEQVTQNDRPTAVSLTPDTVAENEPAGTQVGLLSAIDPDPGDRHTFRLVAGDGGDDNASFSVDGNRLQTTAVLDFEADAELSIRIRATDAAGAKVEQALTIAVTDVDENTVPVAVDDHVAGVEDTVLVLPAEGAGSPAANDTDADGDPVTLTSVSGASGGTVELGGGTIRFTPTQDGCGLGTGGFEYAVADGRGGSASGHVVIDVACTPDPTVARDDLVTVTEDAPATALPVLANDTDADGDPIRVASTTAPAHGTVVITGGGTGLTYLPDPGYCNDPGAAPDDTFSYTLNGGSVAIVSVRVTCVDDAPVAVDDSATVVEDAAATAVDVLADDTDTDAGAMTVGSVTQPAHGTVAITGGGTGLTYRPGANYCNDPGAAPDDTFTYTLNGGSTGTVSMTVTCVDDAPVAVDDSATVVEDAAATAVDVRANDTDTDAGAMTVGSVTQPAHGTVAITGGGTGLSYRPGANYCNDPGPAPDDTFTYTLNGGSTGTVSMTVTCVDDAPVAVDDSATVVEDAAATAVDVRANDTDVDAGPMLIGPVTVPAHGTVAVTGGGTGLTYRPDANYCNDPGPAPDDSFTYTLGGGSTATVTVTVTCVDDLPVAVDDVATVYEDAAASAVDVLTNDTDVDAGAISIASVTQPANGAVAISGGGTGLTYAPDPDYCNNPPGLTLDTFSYTLNGGSTATVSMTVTCDAPPTAVADSATVAEDAGATAVDVLANDTDTDAGPKQVTSVTQPANGTVVIAGGGAGLTYAPDPNYCNNPPGLVLDTFTYTLNGGSTTTASVTVTCVDDAPVAADDATTIAEDAGPSAVDVRANDTDIDGGTKAVVSVTQGSHGTVVITGGGTGLTYAPDANYCNDPGAAPDDTFAYTLNGGSTSTVTVTVTCVDDAPVAVADSATVTEDASATAVDVRGNDTDIDAGTKSVASVTQPAHGTVVITGGGTGLTYAPDANYCNNPPGLVLDTFTYTLNGGSTGTVSMTVTCVDDAPVAVADSATVLQGSGATAVGVLANDTDIDAGAKSVASATQPAHGTVVITGGGSGLTYQPGAGYCNDPGVEPEDTFTYTLDGGSTATVSMTVTCDAAPTAVDDSATVVEDASATAVDVLANDTDVDAGPKTVASVTQPANGTVVITGGGTGLTYAPGANYCNDPGATPDDTFTYTLNGGSTATVSVVVTCVDDAPVAVADSATVTEDDPATAVAVLGNDTDVDAGPKRVASVTQPANGAVVITGGGTGLTYVPDADYCNDPGATPDDTFTYTLNGGSTGTVAVTVTCVPDAPTLTTSAGPATYTEGAATTAVDAGVALTDPDGVTVTGGSVELTANAGTGDVLDWTDNDLGDTITEGASSAHALVLTGNGTAAQYAAALRAVTYANTSDDPSALVRTATFSVATSGGPASGTIDIQVTPVDDTPVAVDDSTTVLEDASATAVAVLGNDTDVDAGPKTVASVTQPTNGAVVITGGGTGLTYAPAANYCNDQGAAPDDTFTYTLNGGSTATVSVVVTCVNDAPVADDETFSGASSAVGNTALVVDDPTDGAPANALPHKSITGDLLAGDADVDGPGPLVIVAGTVASNDGGTVEVEADGDFTYTPAAGASCTDTSDFFDYTVSDLATPTAATDTGRVTIAVSGCVWYVDNAASGDAGTSAAPFDTLAQAQTASGAGDTIFVFDGDGTTTGYAAGIDLLAGQSLVGEAADLQVGSDTLWTGVPGARPTITDSNADVVVLAAANSVRGLAIDPSGAGGGIAGGVGDASGTIADVRIVDTGIAGTQPALELDGTSGTFDVSDLIVDNSTAAGQTSGSVGVRLNNAGTVRFGTGGTISLTTKGAKALDATGTALGAASVFDDITVTGSGSGAVSMVATTGTTTFSNLALTTTSGPIAAFALDSAGTVSVSAGGTANVSATGGPAVDVTATSGPALGFDLVSSIGSATTGISLTGLGTGTFTATDGTIAGAAGAAFAVSGASSGTITYPGAIADGAGSTASIGGRTGGTLTLSGTLTDGADAGGGITVSGNSGGSTVLSGAPKTFVTGASTAVSLSSNTGHTVSVTGGGLAITTTSGSGLAMSGGGTLAVTGTGNTISAGAGGGLLIDNSTIGAGDVTFERISSNGASVGIRANNTGSSGRLIVTGSGGTCTNAVTSGCSGGVIANGTGGDDSSATPGGSGIVLNSTLNPSFTRMWVHDHTNYAVRGTSVAGFTLANSVVNGLNGNNGASPFNDSSVRFDNLTGSAAVSDTYVSGGDADNIRVVNTSGSLNRITFTNTTFGTNGVRPNNDALLLETSTSAGQLQATVTGSTFSSAAGDLLQFNHNGTGTGDLVVNGNAFSNAHPAIATGGGGVSLFSSGTGGDTTMSISNNSFRDAVGPGMLIVKSTGPATQAGTFVNNTIGVAGVANSGSAEGSALKLQQVGQGTSTWSVSANTIRQYNNFGVEVLAGGGASLQSGTINTTITGNTITEPGSNPAIGIGRNGVHLNIGTVPSDTFQACAAIGGAGALANSLTGSGSLGGTDIRLRQRQSTTIRLPGYGGGAIDTAAVQTFVSGNNSPAASSTASTNSPPGGGFVDGAGCPTP